MCTVIYISHYSIFSIEYDKIRHLDIHTILIYIFDKGGLFSGKYCHTYTSPRGGKSEVWRRERRGRSKEKGRGGGRRGREGGRRGKKGWR
jgi:hypothetical protein